MGTDYLRFDSICDTMSKTELIIQTREASDIEEFLNDIRFQLEKGNFYKMIIERYEDI